MAVPSRGTKAGRALSLSESVAQRDLFDCLKELLDGRPRGFSDFPKALREVLVGLMTFPRCCRKAFAGPLAAQSVARLLFGTYLTV